MNILERFFPEVRFGGFSDIDGTIAFYSRVNALLDSSFVILDVGCGRGSYQDDPVPFRKNLRILKGKVATVIGIDVDESAQHNPFLDRFHPLQSDSWPVQSDSVDLVICDSVLEHIANPNEFFMEACRVLKNGGCLCIRTTNRWGYVAVAASLVPNRYHSKVTAIVQDGRKEEDVFPTIYKCNSVWKLKSIMKDNGFDSVVYGYDAEPDYLSFSRITYFFGVMYQRFAPSSIKPAIFAFGRLTKNGR